MDYTTGRANHIEDYLARLHNGQWFGWSDSKNKVYVNLRLTEKIHNPNHNTDSSRPELTLMDNPHSLPTEQECIDGLAALQTAQDDKKAKLATDKASGNSKLKALGLTDDEITAIIKG